MARTYVHLLVFVFACLSGIIQAQLDLPEREEALLLYESLINKEELEPEERLTLANSCYVLDDRACAIQQISFLAKAKNAKYRLAALRMQAKVYMDMHEYEEVVEVLKTIQREYPEKRKSLDFNRMIQQADHAQHLRASIHPVISLDAVNTDDNEWRPVWSDNQWDVWYYTRSDPEYDRLWRVQWEEEAFVDETHVDFDKASFVAGVTSEGSYLYIADNSGHVIRLDTLQHALTLQHLPIEPDKGDCCVHIASEDVVLFSSDRMGGYGGYDLYASVKVRGKWTRAKNLGSVINSRFNELDPHLSLSNGTLYFASDRLMSAGDFDLFSVEVDLEKSSWESVQNKGIGINSARVERFPNLREDGRALLFSSNRSGGKGYFDLYLSYLTKKHPDRTISAMEFYRLLDEK